MKRIFSLAAVVAALALAAPQPASAHEGHDHGKTPGAEGVVTGPVTLTEAAMKNLGVQSVEAAIVPLQRSMDLIARIEGLPERHAKISPRAEGRVTEIFVKLGDQVKAGQQLLKFETLTVGNPPVVLKSPIDGYVIRQETNIGQSLRPESVVMDVADYSQVLARGAMFESADISLIKPGQVARVRLDTFPNEMFEGTVQRLDVGLESDSRTFEVYVLLENPGLKLRPNMFATVTVGLGEAQDVLAVPHRALLGDTGNLFVFVQDGLTFERRAVVLGMRVGDQVEIQEGVLPGDQVVVRGNYQLQFATATAKKPTSGEVPAEGAMATGAAAKPAEDGHSLAAAAKDNPMLAKMQWAQRLPFWAWALIGFVTGGFVFGFLLRRSRDADDSVVPPGSGPKRQMEPTSQSH